MSTVLFADRDGAAFGPLGDRIVPALLPLQAEPALQHTLVAMRDAGLKSALLVVGPRAHEIRKRFGKGIRWGIALEYVELEGEESPGDVLRRLEPRLDGETLVIRGDVGTHALIGDFVAATRGRSEPLLCGTAGGRPAGLWRLSPGTLKKAELPREPASAAWSLGKDATAVPLDEDATLLDSVAAYLAACRSEKPAVSARAEVDKAAALGAGSTVAEEAVVLEKATLKETSILPRSVVPRGLALTGAAVAGNLVVEAGKSWLLTDLLPARGAPASPPGVGSRLAGAVAFLLSLPLWPVALGWAFVANAGHPTREVELVGCAAGTDAEGRPRRAAFRTLQFETAVPVLRDLPLVLSVARGRLALQGVAPLSPAEEAALAEGWEKARLEAPPGLLSLTRLAVPASAAPEVARLVDAFEARTGAGGLVGRGLTALFSARGWVAPKAWNPDKLPEGEPQ